MRKILLATTAIIALSSASAMAADVTISGSGSLIIKNDGNNSAGGGSMDAEQDFSVNFSNTTDNGLTTTASFALDENIEGTGYDGMAWTLGGDFGTLKVTPGDNGDAEPSSNYVAAMDDNANFAAEGTDITPDILGNARGDSGAVIGYALPSVMDGLSIVMEHGSDHFGLGATMGVGPATIKAAQIKGSTTNGSTMSLVMGVAGVTLGYEQNKTETGATETEGKQIGAKYTMDGVTIAYEAGDLKENNTKTNDFSQIAVSYTIAPGISTVLTTSETNPVSGSAVDETEVQIKVSF